MLKSFLAVTAFIILISCNNNNTENAQSNIDTNNLSNQNNNEKTTGTFCYVSMNSKDTVFLKLNIFADSVTGNLSYKLFEKDSNKGNFAGKLNGDTLIADYTFMSEGSESIRQVAFLIQNDIAAEGYGDVQEENENISFKNIHNIDFSKGIKLHKTECSAE